MFRELPEKQADRGGRPRAGGVAADTLLAREMQICRLKVASLHL